MKTLLGGGVLKLCVVFLLLSIVKRFIQKTRSCLIFSTSVFEHSKCSEIFFVIVSPHLISGSVTCLLCSKHLSANPGNLCLSACGMHFVKTGETCRLHTWHV